MFFSVKSIVSTSNSFNLSIVSFGTFYDIKQSNNQQQGFSFYSINSTTFDTTIANTLNVTAQWGAASASNSIHPDIFVLSKIF